MGLRSSVPDQDGRDRINRPNIMPFPAGSQFHNFVMASVIAFHSPVFHQHGLAICEANRLLAAADNICQQAARASVAMFIMISVIHRENAEAPNKGPRDDQDLPSRG
jgi:hypothetical protein